MKIKKLFLLMMLVSSVSFAQTEEENEKRVYDYSETKHELAVDIVPIFGGYTSPSLFYRKNYTTSKGKNMGFRAGMRFNNQIFENDVFVDGFQYKRRNFHALDLTIGIEKQKFLSEKFLAYGGLDLGFYFSTTRFKERTDLFDGNTAYFNQNQTGFNLTNFWGFKYHFNQRLSFSAETGFRLFYNSSIYKSAQDNQGNTPEIASNENFNLGLNLIPLQALRVSYHF